MNGKLFTILGIITSCNLFADTGVAENIQSYPTDQFQPKDSPCFREITPDAGPRVDNGADVLITADFIYWTTKADGLIYAITGRNTGVQINASKGHAQQMEWTGDPGFKVGLGINLPHDGWDIFGQYTWLHTKTHNITTKSFNTPLPGQFVSTFFGIRDGSLNQTYVKAKANWRNKFNVVDLGLGRNYFISQFLTLKPHVGLKGTWQDQEFVVEYTQVDLADINTILIQDDIRFNQDMWGLGIRFGLDTGWQFIKDFGLVANMSLSALWSDFSTKRKDRHFSIALPANSLYYNFNFNQRPINAILEMQLGLRHDFWFCDNDYHVSIAAMWEEQVWINHERFIKFFSNEVLGNFYLHGFTFNLRFDF